HECPAGPDRGADRTGWLDRQEEAGDPQAALREAHRRAEVAAALPLGQKRTTSNKTRRPGMTNTFFYSSVVLRMGERKNRTKRPRYLATDPANTTKSPSVGR